MSTTLDKSSSIIEEWVRRFLEDDEIQFTAVTSAHFDLKREISHSSFGILIRFYFGQLQGGRRIIREAKLGIRYMLDSINTRDDIMEFLEGIQTGRIPRDANARRIIQKNTKNNMGDTPPKKGASFSSRVIDSATKMDDMGILEDKLFQDKNAHSLDQWCKIIAPRFNEIKLFFVKHLVLQGQTLRVSDPT